MKVLISLSYSKAQAVQGMLAFSIFITHGLACYVAIDITWNEYMAKRFPKNTSFWEYSVRTFLVFVTCKVFSTFPILVSSALVTYVFSQSC